MLAVLATMLVVNVGTPAGAVGSGTVLLQDDFMQPTTVGKNYIVGGRNFTPCLTAGTSTTSTPIPGCGGAADAAGAGALRLTDAVTNRAGFLVYDKALPTKAGLDITFNEYQYGGTLADGISFFLTDGQYTLDHAGAYGGSLGYHHNGATEGVPHALLGVGLDVWGNYTVETNDTASCTANYVGTTPDDNKNTIAVRGPGDGKTGYCLLGPAVSVPKLGDATHRTGSPRPPAITVRIVVDPPGDPSPKVKVYLDGSSTPVTTVDEPAALRTTPTFKFGWGASTGGSTDIHEINFLRVESVNPIKSDLALDVSASTVPSGDAASMVLTARTDAASGPVPAGQPVTLTATAPAGTALGTPSGTGWDCTASTSASLSCTRTPAVAIDPATALPPVTVGMTRVTTGQSGTSTISAAVASPLDDDQLLGDNARSVTVKWSPVASAVTGTAVVTSATPTGVTVAPSVVGTGPYTYAVTSTTPSLGTVSVSGQSLVVTPVAGASGLVTGTYQPTDVDGVVGNVATVQLAVAPIAGGGSITTDVDVQGSVTLPLPSGTGTFTAEVMGRSAGLASASVSMVAGQPVLRATSAARVSGDGWVDYRVVDGSGVPSAPVRVPVHVRPVAASDTVLLELDEDGDASLTTALPAGVGTAPLTYALVDDGDLDGATVTLGTNGSITVVADTGVSGSYAVPYTVSDAVGTSTHATVTIEVHPYLGAVATTYGTADAPTTAATPTLVATGPVTWTHTTPAGTSVSVATDGTVTLDPRGTSGSFTVSLTAVDADGLVSAARTLVFVVAPVATPLDGDAVASATPTATVLTPTATGTGPWTLAVATGLAPELGTVTVVGGTLQVTAAAGVSGVLTASYTLTGRHGVASAPVAVVVRVRPVAAAASAVVPSGTTTAVTLPTPTGTGPFTWTLEAVDEPAAGTVTVSGGVATIDAAATWSGPVAVRYTVTDADGLVSAPATLTVTVDPVAPDGGTGTKAVQPGTAGGPVAGPTPSPAGTGPFRFEIVTGPTPEQGTVTIDPDTGVVTFVPAPGFSGPVDVLYQATDGHGTPAAPATVTFQIAPVAAPTGGTPTGSPTRPLRTNTGKRVTTPLPTPVGTGPFTYELVDGPTPDQGTVTIDPVTGELVLVPAPGFSGTLTARYRVVDSTGLVSEPETYRLDVAPTAGPSSSTLTAGKAATVQLPTPQGRGPFTWTLVGGPTADQGTVVLDPATGRLTFVAAPGFTGAVHLTYTVTDADGIVSEVLSANVQVRTVLAATGATLAPLAGAGALLVALGAGLVLAVRRRRA
ncbi:tandem-95 repeat protein [Cellulomonas chitinilytica]|uniref:tandem-95 repeat protein n=1 Tax=Cellulomonas chitinilytica TaxID=398759 RepID=UPI001941C9D4|nr:tandem-95 repeat protein [Cellulomonas chitinilytica]